MNPHKMKHSQYSSLKKDHSPVLNLKKYTVQIHQNVNHNRRHSIYGPINLNQEYHDMPAVKISSKQLKSLQKYKKKSKEKYKKHHKEINFESEYLNKKCYKFMNMVGKGGFGKVWKVQHIKTGKQYAMKQISKAIVITKRSVDSILNQRQLLSTIRHKFIVNMLYAFQDQECLYIIMNLMEGGDLRYHLRQTKFMVASIIVALEHLHSKMIIHRDVKPQNIVFDRTGYAYLTDLGIAKYYRQQNSEDTSGTPGYMAPQVMFHCNHRYEVDFYGIGVIIYEIMIGRRPYLGKSRQEIKLKLKQKQVLIKKKEIPQGWSIESADFVNKLLQRIPVQRLGWSGISQVKNHIWLKNFPWKDLSTGKLISPMKRFYNYQQVRYKATQNETQYNKLLNKNKQMLKKGNMQDYFGGYTYEDLPETAQHTKIY